MLSIIIIIIIIINFYQLLIVINKPYYISLYIFNATCCGVETGFSLLPCVHLPPEVFVLLLLVLLLLPRVVQPVGIFSNMQDPFVESILQKLQGAT